MFVEILKEVEKELIKNVSGLNTKQEMEIRQVIAYIDKKHMKRMVKALNSQEIVNQNVRKLSEE